MSYVEGRRSRKLGWILISGVLFLLAVFAFWLVWHRSRAAIPVTYLNVDQPITSVSSWRIVGPFPLSSSEQAFTVPIEAVAFDKNYLARIGGAEAPLKLGQPKTKVFIDFSKDSLDPTEDEIPGSSAGDFLNQIVHFPSAVVRSRSLFWKSFEVFKVNYAVAALNSSRDADMVFLISGNSPIKLWLNNEVIYQHHAGVVGYSWPTLSVKRVRLHKGLNFVLLKMFCFPKRNDFAFRIATVSRGNDFIDEHGRVIDVLDQLIVPQGTPLTLSQNFEFYGPAAKVDLMDPRGKIVSSSSVTFTSQPNVPTSSVSPGLYTVRATIGKEVFSEDAYVGSPREMVDRYRETRCIHDPAMLCSAIPSLLKALAQPHQDLNQGMFALLSQFVWDTASIRPTTPENPGEHRVQLLSFRSKVDGQIQHYYFYFPAGRHDATIPLVIICPTKHPDITFMDGPPDQGRLQTIAYYADKYGYAFILPYDRGLQQDESALAATDLLEAVGDAQRRFAIDAKRLYLLGECASAKNAILMAERFPDRFAAVSAFRAATGETIEDGEYWPDANNPLRFVRNLTHVPLRLIYGLVDPHSPKEQGTMFQNESQENGVDPELILVPGDGSSLEETEPYRIALEFFNGKSLPSPPNEVDFSTSQLRYNSAYWLQIDRLTDSSVGGSVHARLELPARIVLATQNVSRLTLLPSHFPEKSSRDVTVSINGADRVLSIANGRPVSLMIDPHGEEDRANTIFRSHQVDGPLSNAFADAFLIVQGTGGTSQRQKETKELVDQMEGSWQTAFRAKCPVVLDKAVTPSEMGKFNLILVGEIGDNPSLARVRALIPFRVEPSGISLGDQNISGKTVLGTMLYPNLLYPDRYALVIDFNEAEGFRLPDLVSAGIYDAMAWNRVNDSQSIAGQWYWDTEWKHLR